MNAILCILCGLFVDVGMSAHRALPMPTEPGHTHWLYDITHTRNPYGSVAVGYQSDISRRLSVSLSLRHESSLSVGDDHGTDSVALTVRFMPWRDRQ